MSETVCCVCGKERAVKLIGSRPFCEEHYRAATYERSGIWRSLVILIVAMAVFVGAVYLGVQVVKPVFTSTTLLITGLALALVPAAIWLVFFYQQDRVEPDPKGYVIG